MCRWLVYTDILNNKLGESGYREVLAVNGRFRGVQPSLLFVLNNRINSPKKLTPEERLKRYIEFKYGKLNVQKKNKDKKDEKIH